MSDDMMILYMRDLILFPQLPNQVTTFMFSIFTHAATAAKSLQSYLTLSDPMDCSVPGSSIHGICKARVLEWVAIAFSSFYS